MRKLITDRISSPFPRFNWRAYWDEDIDSPWHQGWGSTEEEAIADLRRLDQERREAEEDEPPNDGDDYADRADNFRPPWRE